MSEIWAHYLSNDLWILSQLRALHFEQDDDVGSDNYRWLLPMQGGLDVPSIVPALCNKNLCWTMPASSC